MINPKELREEAQGISILYVEDDRELRQHTTRLLSSFFNDITTAENGLEGLIKYKQHRYDLILTDINMPVMNGVKLSEQIKSDNPRQVIIVISAHDESSYLLELINLGVDYFVLKPLDMNQFLTVLDKAIRLTKLTKWKRTIKIPWKQPWPKEPGNFQRHWILSMI